MVVTTGVAIASYGEINFVVIGVVLQLISVLTESTRLTMVQILLQVRAAWLHLLACPSHLPAASSAMPVSEHIKTLAEAFIC